MSQSSHCRHRHLHHHLIATSIIISCCSKVQNDLTFWYWLTSRLSWKRVIDVVLLLLLLLISDILFWVMGPNGRDRQTDRQTDRFIDRQVHRQTYKQHHCVMQPARGWGSCVKIGTFLWHLVATTSQLTYSRPRTPLPQCAITFPQILYH